MPKIWFSELWENPGSDDLGTPETYYGQTETKSFFDYTDPNKKCQILGKRPSCKMPKTQNDSD